MVRLIQKLLMFNPGSAREQIFSMRLLDTLSVWYYRYWIIRENSWNFAQDVSTHDSQLRVLWHHQGAVEGILGARGFSCMELKSAVDVISETDFKECTCSVSRLLLEGLTDTSIHLNTFTKISNHMDTQGPTEHHNCRYSQRQLFS